MTDASFTIASDAIATINMHNTGLPIPNCQGKDFLTSFLLTLSGPLTAAPLILFTYGALRVALSTVGILQYLNPSLQFFCASVLFLEPLTIWHMISFPLIWLGLAIYSWAGIRSSIQSER